MLTSHMPQTHCLAERAHRSTDSEMPVREFSRNRHLVYSNRVWTHPFISCSNQTLMGFWFCLVLSRPELVTERDKITSHHRSSEPPGDFTFFLFFFSFFVKGKLGSIKTLKYFVFSKQELPCLSITDCIFLIFSLHLVIRLNAEKNFS